MGIQLYFRKLGVELESEHTRKFFDLLDFDSDGRLNLDEFVLGLSKLHGKARSIDVAHLLHDSNRISKQLNGLTTLCEEAFKSLDVDFEQAYPSNRSDRSSER